MLNKDKLIKIQRILSAQQGAQVPNTQKPSNKLISYDVWKGILGNNAKNYADYLAELGKLSKGFSTQQDSPEDEDPTGQNPDQENSEKITSTEQTKPEISTTDNPQENLVEAANKSSSLDDPKLQTNVDQKKEADKRAPIPENEITSSVTQGLEEVQKNLKENQNGSTVSKITGALTTAIPTVVKIFNKSQEDTTGGPTNISTQNPGGDNNQTQPVNYTNPAPDTDTLIDPKKQQDKFDLEHKKKQVTDILHKDMNPVNGSSTESGGDGSSQQNQLNPTKKFSEMSGTEKANHIGSVGGSYGAMAGAAIDTASEMLVDKSDFADDSWTNSEGRSTYDAVSNSLMSMGGYGAMAGAAMKAVGLINDLGGSKTQDFSADKKTIEQVGGSYGGTVSDINDAVSVAGKKYGLFEAGARNSANERINAARKKQNTMAGIAKTASEQSDAATYSHDNNVLNYQYQINGGYDQRFMRAAKEGGNIEYFKDPFKVTLSDINDFKVELSDVPTLFKSGGTLLDKLDNNVFKVELSNVPELEKFKEGGSIKDREIEVIETDTTQKSVIPEGALHKNKHHLDNVGVDDSELTKKGIPVVDNQGEQQAEIELNEIIFTLEVTKELESRYKEFYEEDTSSARKDELAIEAGKLLWKEILYNTDDRTGLIDTLKQGGSLKAKETSKPEYSEWIKDVNPEFINDNYDLEAAYKYLPYEQLEHWKTAVNSPDPDKYLNYQDPKTGEYTYHLGSVAQLDNGDYVFLKKGTEKTNPELHWETDTYYNGTNGLKETHDLVYDGKEGRYFYRRRTTPKKHREGGTITILEQAEVTKMIKQALIDILTNNG